MKTATRTKLAGMAVALLLAVGMAGASTPVAAAVSGCAEVGTSTPVLLVHGWNSDSNVWKSMIQMLDTMPAVAVDSFDYRDVHDQWVDNPGIGQALAERIDCLSRQSTAAGGGGKVVIVAHSMGGLAARCAASPACSGGPQVADKIGEVITLGTPNEGSFLRGGAGQSQAIQLFLKSLTLDCFALSGIPGSPAGALCDQRQAMLASLRTPLPAAP